MGRQTNPTREVSSIPLPGAPFLLKLYILRPEVANFTRAGLNLGWSRPGMVNAIGAGANPDQGNSQNQNWASDIDLNRPVAATSTGAGLSQHPSPEQA